MGEANSKIAPSSIFRPVSTPAHDISPLAIFVLAVTTAVFVIVSRLLTYGVIRFRSRRGDDGSEPPQIYGSGPVEFAWTAVPVLTLGCGEFGGCLRRHREAHPPPRGRQGWMREKSLI